MDRHLLVAVMAAFVACAVSACSPGGPAASAQTKEGGAAPGQKDPAAEAPKPAAVTVRVADVTTERVPLVIEISGQLASPEDSAIAAEVEGKVVKISVDLGDRVRQGQVLAQINPDEFRYKMEQADAMSQQADSNLKRIEKLAKSEMVSPQQLDDARSTATQAKASADLARKKFQDTQVVAPFNGAIAKRSVSLGEYVRVGQALFEVVVLDQLKLTGEIPERYLPDVKNGDEVSAEVNAYRGQPFKGKISRISPSVNPTSRSFTVEARIDNKDGKLKPGIFARARLNIGVEENATIVPEIAVATFAGVARVYKIEGKVAKEIRVDIDQHLSEGRLMLSKSALKPGDKVAVEGVGRLADGVEVQIR